MFSKGDFSEFSQHWITTNTSPVEFQWSIPGRVPRFLPSAISNSFSLPDLTTKSKITKPQYGGDFVSFRVRQTQITQAKGRINAHRPNHSNPDTVKSDIIIWYLYLWVGKIIFYTKIETAVRIYLKKTRNPLYTKKSLLPHSPLSAPLEPPCNRKMRRYNGQKKKEIRERERKNEHRVPPSCPSTKL